MTEQAALYRFTDQLFRAQSAEDIYAAALDAIVRALGCDRASILLFDEFGIMKFVAWRGLSEEYRRAVEGHSPWSRDTKDPLPISIGDIDAAELDATLKATVKSARIAALAFIPLVVQGQLIGKFMTYYPAPHVFSDGEMGLAVTIARQLGFGLERMGAEEQRRQAEEAKELLLNESRHRIKNTLATVQAIAGQTLVTSPPANRRHSSLVCMRSARPMTCSPTGIGTRRLSSTSSSARSSHSNRASGRSLPTTVLRYRLRPRRRWG